MKASEKMALAPKPERNHLNQALIFSGNSTGIRYTSQSFGLFGGMRFAFPSNPGVSTLV